MPLGSPSWLVFIDDPLRIDPSRGSVLPCKQLVDALGVKECVSRILEARRILRLSGDVLDNQNGSKTFQSMAPKCCQRDVGLTGND